MAIADIVMIVIGAVTLVATIIGVVISALSYFKSRDE